MWQVYQNVFFTPGFNRTLVFDSLKLDINFIPNELFHKLKNSNFLIYEDSFDKEDIEYLLSKDLIFKINPLLLGRFPKMEESLTLNCDLAVLTIEVSKLTTEHLFKISFDKNKNSTIGQYNFVFSDFSSLSDLKTIRSFLEHQDIDAVEFTILKKFRYSDDFFYEFKDLNRLIIINNFTGQTLEDKYASSGRRMFVDNNDYKSIKIIPDLPTYLESSTKHVYFYNKILISKDGTIRNSKETPYVYGNLKNLEVIDLERILNDEQINYLWEVKKEDTIICKDCEFRRLCNDNRMPVKNRNYWYHFEECQYNPYISKWEDEDGYKSLKDSGIEITNGEMKKDSSVIQRINELLWLD